MKKKFYLIVAIPLLVIIFCCTQERNPDKIYWNNAVKYITNNKRTEQEIIEKFSDDAFQNMIRNADMDTILTITSLFRSLRNSNDYSIAKNLIPLCKFAIIPKLKLQADPLLKY